MSRIEFEPAVMAGAVAAVFGVAGVAATRRQSTTIAAGIAAGVALVQAVITRSLVSPVTSVENARNEGAAQMLDAVAESRLDPDLWEAIRAVPAATYADGDYPDHLDPSDPHGKEQVTS
jgi:hypothetical protein